VAAVVTDTLRRFAAPAAILSGLAASAGASAANEDIFDCTADSRHIDHCRMLLFPFPPRDDNSACVETLSKGLTEIERLRSFRINVTSGQIEFGGDFRWRDGRDGDFFRDRESKSVADANAEPEVIIIRRHGVTAGTDGSPQTGVFEMILIVASKPTHRFSYGSNSYVANGRCGRLSE